MVVSKNIIISVFSIIFVQYIYCDTVTIINETPIDLFGAIYYTKDTYKRASQPFALPTGKNIQVERPERRLYYDRDVYFSPNIEALTPELSSGEAQFIPHFNIGALKGDTFYIIFYQGAFKGYSAFEKTINPVLQQLKKLPQNLSEAMFGPLRKTYQYNHKNEEVTVRTSKELSQQEQQFLAQRIPLVKKTLEKIVGKTLNDHEVPKIALCASGGGYRAMVSFLGSVKAFKDANFFDAITYMAGLSGGAWGVTLATMIDNPLEEVGPRLSKNLTSEIDINILLSLLWQKFIFDQPLSTIDIYGLLLSNRLLGGSYKNPMELTLSNQIKNIEQGKRPFPLYAAIITKKPYEWIECNPYEVRSEYLQGAVPTWAFNSKFNNGKSQGIDPEQSLGFLMGIWGSAFSANIQEIYRAMRDKISSSTLLSALDAGTHEELVGAVRVLPAKVRNFTYGMHTLPRWQQEILTLIDAGIDFNLPVPPLLGRADVIIIFDNSLHVLITKAGQLKAVEQYAQRKNIPFSAISYEQIVKKQCSVFFDKNNPKAPLIIYFPLINNKNYSSTFDVQKCMTTSYCSTTNFNYSQKEIQELSGLTAFNVTESMNIIRQALNDFIEVRRKIK